MCTEPHIGQSNRTNRLNTISLLLVCYDHAAKNVYLSFFDSNRIQIKIAVDFHSALQATDQENIDVVVVDAGDDPKASLDLCGQLKSDPIFLYIPILYALNQLSDIADTVSNFFSLADDFLLKPINQIEFQFKLKNLLRFFANKKEMAHLKIKLTKTQKKNSCIQTELLALNRLLLKEREMVKNSLKQISLMTEEREQYRSRIKKLNTIIKKNIGSIINLMGKILDIKPQYHKGHAKRVADISEFIGTAFDLPPKKVQDIKTAALLHELGKISLPEPLMLKHPTQYSDNEKNLFDQHPQRGALLLRNFIGFGKVAKIIRHLYERVDGTGKPDGLKRDKIPLASRIIAIASYFDNMVHTNKDTTPLMALQIIENSIGSKYDAAVVHRLHRYVQKEKERFNTNVKEIHLYDLHPGMTTATGIFMGNGAKLIAENTLLTESMIQQIMQHNNSNLLEETVYIKA